MEWRRILSLTVVTVLACAASSVRGQPAASPVVCLYDDRSFSDGANICVQKNLMMSCTVTGEKPVWTLVRDKDLSERCLEPFQVHTADLNARWHRHVVRRQARADTPLTPASAPCFTFNGKRYCE
jgi:hypothetical protein